MKKIVIISDTHEKHENIEVPEGDILIHCGDSTNRGSLFQFNKFLAWMKKQAPKHKVLVFGNHELGFSKSPKQEEAIESCKQFGIQLLQDSGITIEGLKIFGQPWQPFFYDWEFNVPRGKEIAKKWELIPEDTQILITHGPPYGILDLVELSPFEERDAHQGCEELRKRVESLKNLKLHAFGHLHGNEQFVEMNGCKFVNAAMVNDRHQLGPKPVVVEL